MKLFPVKSWKQKKKRETTTKKYARLHGQTRDTLPGTAPAVATIDEIKRYK